MNKVTSSNIMWNKGEPNAGSAWASDLGFKPGEWPAEFVISETHMVYRKVHRVFNNDDEIVYVKYVNGDGDAVNVHND